MPEDFKIVTAHGVMQTREALGVCEREKEGVCVCFCV
jgi:hypothetical protein